MNSGFEGNAFKRYFNMMSAALKESEECLNNSKSLSKTDEGEIVRTSEKLVSCEEKLYGGFSNETVFVEDEKYEYIGNQMKIMDENIQNMVVHVVDKLESLCDESYNIPSATPAIRRALTEIRNMLNVSAELTQNTNRLLQRFVADMQEIDN